MPFWHILQPHSWLTLIAKCAWHKGNSGSLAKHHPNLRHLPSPEVIWRTLRGPFCLWEMNFDCFELKTPASDVYCELRYEANIGSAAIRFYSQFFLSFFFFKNFICWLCIGRFAIGTWYLYALVTTASYAGEIRFFFYLYFFRSALHIWGWNKVTTDILNEAVIHCTMGKLKKMAESGQL